MIEEYRKIVNEFCELAGNKDEDYTTLKCMEIARLERIAEALEGLNESGRMLSDCVGYVPPRWHMTEGYHIFRIGGQVNTE